MFIHFAPNWSTHAIKLFTLYFYSRRRSRRTRFRNLRYSSPERGRADGSITITPDIIENDATKYDEDDFLLQEPSSSTTTRRLQPRVMLKRRRMIGKTNVVVVDLLAKSLKEIGLYEELYEFMKSRGITADALKYMKLRHIDELFKGTRLSTKIVFEHKLKEWQNKKGICEVSTTQPTTSQLAVIKPKIEQSIQQTFSAFESTDLSDRLIEAIQQTINTVLKDFETSSSIKDNKKENVNLDLERNEEIAFPEATDDNSSKAESFAFMNIDDETPIPEKVQKKAAKKVLNPFVNTEEPKPSTIKPEKTHKRKREKSPKILTPKSSFNNIFLETLKSQDVVYSLETSVEEILEMNPFGRRFMQEYQSSGILTPNQRTELVRTIVEYYLKTNESLTVTKCREIAEQIIDIFPTECMETYFTQPNKRCPPKGKIWDRYRGRKRQMRIADGAEKSTSNKFDSSMQLDDTMDKTNWSEMEELCSRMKSIEDERELLEQWKNSFTFRRYQLQSDWFSNWKLYFDEYPFVKQQNYAQYIDSDLNTLYPNLKFDEFLWDEFLKCYKLFFLNRIKHPKSKQTFEDLLSVADLDPKSDYLAIKIVELLHALFPPKMNASIEDGQRQFSVEVNDLADLKKVVIERKKHCIENKLPSKPYIAVVGQNRTYTHFSVILDSTGFSCDSYKEALILCFNLFLFFDLSFPHETLGVWLFIQKYFFNKPSLVTNPRVETFIHDIKAQKKLTIDLKHGVFDN